MNWALLLAAIAVVESGGNPAAVGDRGRSVGAYQIQAICVADVNRIHGTDYRWPEDARNPVTAAAIARTYLEHWTAVYTRRTGDPVTPEVAARIWNGGPRGYERAATVNYWQKVEKELEKTR